MEKLPGVESAEVSLNEGRAVIRLKPGNAITLAQIRETVRRNGFTPQQALITADAEVAGSGDTLQVKISGTSDTYDVAGTAHPEAVRQQLRDTGGHRVVVEGIVPVPKDLKAAPVIQVNSVKPSARD